MDFSIVDHKMVSPQYGTDADLRDLVKKAHDKGISSFDALTFAYTFGVGIFAIKT
jgi:hypothetical protein